MSTTYEIDFNEGPISHQVPNDVEVGFHWFPDWHDDDARWGEYHGKSGGWIENPWMSEKDEPVTPEYYGFSLAGTGGGCTAWELIVDADEEEEFLLTSLDDPVAPESAENGWLLTKRIRDILVWEFHVSPNGTGKVVRHDGPLTVEQAAYLALRYAELLNDIDEGEHTPDLAEDLNRIRAALGLTLSRPSRAQTAKHHADDLTRMVGRVADDRLKTDFPRAVIRCLRMREDEWPEIKENLPLWLANALQAHRDRAERIGDPRLGTASAMMVARVRAPGTSDDIDDPLNVLNTDAERDSREWDRRQREGA